jgi:hypothetical protein
VEGGGWGRCNDSLAKPTAAPLPLQVLCDMLYALVALDFRLSDAKMQQLLGALQRQLPQMGASSVVTCVLCFGRMEAPPGDDVLTACLARVNALLGDFSSEDLGVGCATAGAAAGVESS